MSTIAQVQIPVEEFALRETLPHVPNVSIEINRLVEHDSPSVMPFLWAIGGDLDRFEDAIAVDETVEDFERLTRFDGEGFYQMKWVDSINVLTHMLVERDAAILNVRGSENSWNLRILFPDRKSLGDTKEYCANHGYTFDVRQLYQLTHDNQRTFGLFGLTESQYKCIITALEAGYYEIPRAASARDISEQLGISHQAVSERLRRGHRNLITNALVTAPYHEQPPENEEEIER